MDQHISVRILKIILVITYGYVKCCNASQIIYKRFMFKQYIIPNHIKNPNRRE